MISYVSPRRCADTADGDVHVDQGQLGWLVKILALRLSPGSTTTSISVYLVAYMITVRALTNSISRGCHGYRLRVRLFG
jgi:hypothetical protein